MVDPGEGAISDRGRPLEADGELGQRLIRRAEVRRQNVRQARYGGGRGGHAGALRVALALAEATAHFALRVLFSGSLRTRPRGQRSFNGRLAQGSKQPHMCGWLKATARWHGGQGHWVTGRWPAEEEQD